MQVKKLRFMACVLAVSLLVASCAAAAPLTNNQHTSVGAVQTGAFAANVVPEGKSPITGLDWTGIYRPVMVQISNSAEARPHWNLSEADIVYESILWGPGHTRYSAIYSDNHPDFVGAVRSARWHHCELREEWDCPFVFWGGQSNKGTSIYDFFKDNGVLTSFRLDGTGRDGLGQSRVNSRVSPHNAVWNIAKVANEIWPDDPDTGKPYEPRVHAMRFSSTPSYGSDTAVEISIVYDSQLKDGEEYAPHYVYDADSDTYEINSRFTGRDKPEYAPSYTYNAATKLYERWYCGEKMIDGQSDKRIVAANVIVQYTPLYYYNNSPSRPVITTTGGGVMDAFIAGRHIRGTWVRSSLSDRTVFLDPSGEEITLLPGKTFIQILPNTMEYTYTRADGSVANVTIGYEVEGIYMDTEEGDAELDNM